VLIETFMAALSDKTLDVCIVDRFARSDVLSLDSSHSRPLLKCLEGKVPAVINMEPPGIVVQ
jgi:hypothetical protein